MGLDGFIVEVQTDISNGLRAFDMIGLPDAAVREARERAKASIKNSGCEYPRKRITINLAPASLKKEGSGFDLAITIGILAASGQINIPDPEKTVFIGELALDGSVKAVNGVLPMVISAYEHGFTKCFVPAENADEAAVIQGIEVYPVRRLGEVLDHFDGVYRIGRHMPGPEILQAAESAAAIDMIDVKAVSYTHLYSYSL